MKNHHGHNYHHQHQVLQIVFTIKISNFLCIFLLSGDQHSRRGALTGGFYDSQKSRLDLQRKVGQAKNRLEEQEKQLESLKTKIADILSFCLVVQQKIELFADETVVFCSPWIERCSYLILLHSISLCLSNDVCYAFFIVKPLSTFWD